MSEPDKYRLKAQALTHDYEFITGETIKRRRDLEASIEQALAEVAREAMERAVGVLKRELSADLSLEIAEAIRKEAHE